MTFETAFFLVKYETTEPTETLKEIHSKKTVEK